MKELLKLVEAQIVDEENGIKEYQELITQVGESDLADSDKVLLKALFDKLRADEESHKIILGVVKDILN